MKVSRVYTNRVCNQNCAFCNVRTTALNEDPAFVATEAVLRRVADTVVEGGELVLTGGEPTMRRDLPLLVRRARDAGAERVVLESNGTLLTDDRARALADAGLDLLRVHLPVWGEGLDTITRDPGGHSATLVGLRAAAAAGIAIEASAPVVRANVDTVPALPAALAGSDVPFGALVLSVPVEAPDERTLAPMAAAARAIADAESAARRLDLALRLESHAALPPCVFDRPGPVAHLFSLTRGGGDRTGFTRVGECERCAVADRCPGFPEKALAREPEIQRSAIVQDQLRRRLSIRSSIEEQVQRELFQDDLFRWEDGRSTPMRIVRVNFNCNQSCRFCFVSTHLPPAEQEAVEGAIVEIARRKGWVILSGGEPTLNARLPDYIRLARREGARRIELQTNAVHLGDPELADRLVEAGLDVVLVSLHGSCPEVSDAVTRAPGTFEQTVAGIERLAGLDLELHLNFVFCELNRRDFPAFVRLVGDRWPEVLVTVSFVAPSTDVIPVTRELIPRYSDVLPSLREGLRLAGELGVTLEGFEAMCGIPFCLVPGDRSSYFELAEIPEGFDGGEFVKTDACGRCDLSTRCFGVRRGYAELWGTDEFVPVLR